MPKIAKKEKKTSLLIRKNWHKMATIGRKKMVGKLAKK